LSFGAYFNATVLVISLKEVWVLFECCNFVQVVGTMGKYTKYSHGYPTIWSNWMYPPKNVTTFQYLGSYFRGLWKAQHATYKANWTMAPCILLFGYIWYRISKDGGEIWLHTTLWI